MLTLPGNPLPKRILKQLHVRAEQPMFLTPKTALAPERNDPLDDDVDTQTGGVE
jgi:hypothetical protein